MSNIVEFEHDDLICSSIIDFSGKNSHLFNCFSKSEWKELSDVKNCMMNKESYVPIIEESNMMEIKKHLYVFYYCFCFNISMLFFNAICFYLSSCLRKKKEYEKNNGWNEGTWRSDCVTLPFTIASREVVLRFLT